MSAGRCRVEESRIISRMSLSEVSPLGTRKTTYLSACNGTTVLHNESDSEPIILQPVALVSFRSTSRIIGFIPRAQ